MRKFAKWFFGLTVVSALIGFGGWELPGIEVARVATIIFADLLVVSLLAKAVFPKQKLRNRATVK